MTVVTVIGKKGQGMSYKAYEVASKLLAPQVGIHKRVACLWSGGLDSTTALYYFADKYPDITIQPYHLLIRRGGGKDARERAAVDAIYPLLRDRFPNVLLPERVKHRMSPSDDRNQLMVKFLNEEYGEKIVILGTHLDPTMHTDPNDSTWEAIEEETGIEIWDLRREGFPTKREQFQEGVKILGRKILSLTWSCQMWWKKPCGRCYSCKDRNKLFEEVR